MKTFKNANFIKRDYECTNIVACKAEVAPKDGKWVECDESALNGLTQLWIQGGVAFFGYL